MKTEMKPKERYQPPMVEVIPMETEGDCMTASLTGNGPGDIQGAGIIGTSTGTYRYNSASSSDLEDMINDILTIEQ